MKLSDPSAYRYGRFSFRPHAIVSVLRDLDHGLLHIHVLKEALMDGPIAEPSRQLHSNLSYNYNSTFHFTCFDRGWPLLIMAALLV